jgi:hypothetical protein
MKTSIQLRREIAELQKQLALAEQAEQQIDAGDPQAIATALHTIQCHYNHIDQCDWEYGSWNKPTFAHTEYLKKAQRLIDSAADAGIPPSTALFFLITLR